MDWIPDRYRELRSRLWPERLEEDIAEEIEHHLSLLTEESIRRGLAPDAARRAALERFGDVERYRAATRAIDESYLRKRRRMEHLDAIRRELRHALRGLACNPSFATVTVLTLALGIGAVTAIFAVLHSVVLSPLPYAEADRLVYIDSHVPGSSLGSGRAWGLSEAGYFHFRDNSRAFEHIGVYAGAFASNVWANLTDDRGARRVPGMAVSASLFDALGARAVVGRLFTAEEDRPGGPDVVVLSHDLWQREYGGDPAVVGSTIMLNLEPREVVGVMAPGFRLPDRRVDVWVPLRLNPAARPVNAHYLAAVGIGLGIAGALVTTRLLRALLFEVSPTDPLTLGAAAALLLVVGLLASLDPARRAARVDPMLALRAE